MINEGGFLKKMHYYRCWISLLVCLCLPYYVVAQGSAEFRTGTSVRCDLGKRWKVSLATELRFNDQPAFRSFLVVPEVGFSINKKWSLEAAYRHVEMTNTQKHRFIGVVKWSDDYKPWRLTAAARLRFDREWEPSEWGKRLLRPRFELAYNIKKIPVSPFVFTELFYGFIPSESVWQRYRFGSGLSWSVNKQHRIEAIFWYEKETAEPPYGSFFIFELSHRWRFRWR